MIFRRVSVAALLTVGLILCFGVGYKVFRERKRQATARKLFCMSEQGLSRLRDAFNGDACSAIYEDASGGFRRAVARPQWLAQCESLRTDLGMWRRSMVRLYEIPGRHSASFAQLEGQAFFAQGGFQLASWWFVENGRAELVSLRLSNQAKTLWLPRDPFSERPPWTDWRDG